MPDVFDLFSPLGIVGFITGAVTSYLYWVWKLNRTSEEVPKVSVVWIVAATVVLGIGNTAAQARENRLATEGVIRCNQEVSVTLARWVEVNADNAKLAVMAEKADASSITKLVRLPESIASSPQDSPERRAYYIDVITDWQQSLNTIAQQRDENDAELRRNPIPEPRC